jgi:hypothetical protein
MFNNPELNKSFLSNLRGIFSLATDTDKLEGLTWYRDAHDFCANVANKTGYSLEQVAGVVSALSPSSFWEKNKASAVNLIFAVQHGLELPYCYTYTRNRDKAVKILEQGLDALEIDTVLNAPKTRSFFWNILQPDMGHAVTIDGHMGHAALDGVRKGISQFKKSLTPKLYSQIQEAITVLASEYGFAPCQMQAILWLAYRRLEFKKA